MRSSILATVAVVVGISAMALDAQQNPRTLGPGSAPQATVDFVAVDAKGQPVTSLTAADVAIRIDGKARDVRDLRLIRHEAPTPLGVEAPAPLPAPFATNAAVIHRTVFIIIDNETITTGREQRVRDGMLAMLNLLGPRDEAALVTVPHGGVAIELTTDRAKLRAAVGQLAGARPLSETDDEAACRSRLTVQAVTSLLAQRAGADAPIEVVFVSSSLSGPRSNVSSGSTAIGRGNMGGCELPSDDFTKLGAAAAAARAHVYIIQPESVGTTTASSANALAGLENIASLTGGYIWHMAGTDEPGFQRVAAETSAYYSATFDLDPSDRGAATRPLSIKVAKADVVVRARPTIALGPAAFGAAAPSPKDMLRTATVYRNAPLRVAAFASRNPGDGKVRIMAVAEPIVPGVKFSAVSIGVYDTAGKLLSQWSANATELAAPALVAAFVQNPGQYRVRVAAIDAAGRAGTADYDLNTTFTPAAGTLTLSSMMIGTGGAAFTPKLLVTNEPQVLAYFELYGGKPDMPVSVAMELATTLNGPAMVQLKPQISASGEPDLFRVVAPIELGALPAGDYVVRAIVGLDGQPAGRIFRTLKKMQ